MSGFQNCKSLKDLLTILPGSAQRRAIARPLFKTQKGAGDSLSESLFLEVEFGLW